MDCRIRSGSDGVRVIAGLRTSSLRGAIATKRLRILARACWIASLTLAMTRRRHRSRGAYASELCLRTHRKQMRPRHTHDPEKWRPVFGQGPCAEKREAERRKAHANHSAPHQQTSPFADASGAAARQFGARSPSGAPPRHSPGRTHPPLAQLQFPRFLRPDLTGVTRFDLSRVYRAPRRPVVVPAERWPRAARE